MAGSERSDNCPSSVYSGCQVYNKYKLLLTAFLPIRKSGNRNICMTTAISPNFYAALKFCLFSYFQARRNPSDHI